MMPADVFIDTIGVGFAYPLARLLFGVKVVSYTHYPTISSDMMKQIDIISFNNQHSSKTTKFVKKVYYRILLWLYSYCGRFADQHSANGTWTFNHITKLWGAQNVALIYPPCDTRDIVRTIDLMGEKKNILVSFAQFRPEKDHQLQLRVWQQVVKKLPAGSKFIMIGATRGNEDQDLVNELKRTAFDFGISSSVEFWENKPRVEIVQLFSQAKVAIHTMKEEHFGISVVEMMAAGLVTIAHNSAGPMLDIIGKSEQVVGYLCENEADYAASVERSMNRFGESFTLALRQNARKWVTERFGVDTFERLFTEMIIKATN